ncbi:alpha/beta fold hydrolase [Pseudooceanicola algae]|uniref:Uncharacterized protein n=1 Tax=Pseudooceanicola algae TaxID=1537215 RepID=A0A418SDV0_9RHOB|nr:alpha/beta hydrolase [Pseudooceanicola algae]QPM89531.1 hypothetical protein PSAL_007520 [Pseudooceanicola algae]
MGRPLTIAAGVLLVLLVIGIATTLWRADRRSREARAAFPPLGQMVLVDGQPVHALQMGSGPDLVLLHGASGNLRDFTFALAPRLAQDFRVTLFDRPGLGHSPALAPRGVTLKDQADLLSRAAAQLGVTRPVVVGQSFGGAVALAWAVHFPDRIAGLVSVAGASHPWEGPIGADHRILAAPVLGPVVSTLAAAWVSTPYVNRQVAGAFDPQQPPSGYTGHLGAALTLQSSVLRANAQQRVDLREELRQQSQRYPTLDLPVEILHGTADRIVGLDIHSRPLAADVPGARLTVLPGIGHMPHHASADAVTEAITRAIRRSRP